MRYEFLMDSIRVAFENDQIEQNTRDIMLQMYEGIYNYLYQSSDLKEIKIPEDLINNIFNRMVIITELEIQIVMRLIRENKKNL